MMNQKYCRNSQQSKPKTPNYQRQFKQIRVNHFGVKDKQDVKPKCKMKVTVNKIPSKNFSAITEKMSVIGSTSNISKRSQSIKSSNISLDPIVQSFPKVRKEIIPRRVKPKVIDLNKPPVYHLDAQINKRSKSVFSKKPLKKIVVIDSIQNLKQPRKLKNHSRVGSKQSLNVSSGIAAECRRPMSAPTGTKLIEGKKLNNKKKFPKVSSEITCQKRQNVNSEYRNTPRGAGYAQKNVFIPKKVRNSSRNSNKMEIRIEGLPSRVSIVCDTPDMNPQLLDSLTPVVSSYFASTDGRSDDDSLKYENELEEYIKKKIVEYEEAERFLAEKHSQASTLPLAKLPTSISLRKKNRNFTLSHSILGSINSARSNLLEQANIIIEEPSIESICSNTYEDVDENEQRNEQIDKHSDESKDLIETGTVDTYQEVDNGSKNLSEEVNRVLLKAIFALSQCERETEQNNLIVRKILEQLEEVNVYNSDTHGERLQKKKVEEKTTSFKNIGPDGHSIDNLDASLDIQELLFELFGANESKDVELGTNHNSRESLRRGYFTLSEGSQNSSAFQTCQTHISADNRAISNNSTARLKSGDRSYTNNPLSSVVEKLSPTGNNFVENLKQYEKESNVSNSEDFSSCHVQSSYENMSTFTDRARISGISSNVEKRGNSDSQFPETENPDIFQANSPSRLENDLAETADDENDTLPRSSFLEKVGEAKDFECFTNWEEGPILHIPRKISSIFASYVGDSLASIQSAKLSNRQMVNRERTKIDEADDHQLPQTEESAQMVHHELNNVVLPSSSSMGKGVPMLKQNSTKITISTKQTSSRSTGSRDFTLAPDISVTSNMEILGRDIQDFRDSFRKKVSDSESSTELSDISMTSSDLLEESKLAVERILNCMRSCSLDSNADWSLSRQSSISDLVQHIARQEQNSFSEDKVEHNRNRYMKTSRNEARYMFSPDVNTRKRKDDANTELPCPPIHLHDRAKTPKSKINERVMKIIIDLLGKDN